MFRDTEKPVCEDASSAWASRAALGFRAGDTNLYRYVGNDPVNGLDPSGLQEPKPGPLKGSFGNTEKYLTEGFYGAFAWGILWDVDGTLKNGKGYQLGGVLQEVKIEFSPKAGTTKRPQIKSKDGLTSINIESLHYMEHWGSEDNFVISNKSVHNIPLKNAGLLTGDADRAKRLTAVNDIFLYGGDSEAEGTLTFKSRAVFIRDLTTDVVKKRFIFEKGQGGSGALLGLDISPAGKNRDKLAEVLEYYAGALKGTRNATNACYRKVQIQWERGNNGKTTVTILENKAYDTFKDIKDW